MCGMYLTNDMTLIPTLRKLNSARGSVNKPLNEIMVDTFVVGHFRAGTSGDSSTLHPAKLGEGDDTKLLWHNGIIKDKSMKKYGYTGWDTKALLDYMDVAWNDADCEIQAGLTALKAVSDFEGSYALFYRHSKGNMFVVRNLLSPLWVLLDGDKITLSSVQFAGSNMLPANVVYNIRKGELNTVGYLSQNYNPFIQKLH